MSAVRTVSVFKRTTRRPDVVLVGGARADLSFVDDAFGQACTIKWARILPAVASFLRCSDGLLNHTFIV
ncbi:MAG: hypothetical protein VXY56_01090 [Pseudomonadota bacterium]|nr:hypothetical protein [Pseudomonadota bacterium]